MRTIPKYLLLLCMLTACVGDPSPVALTQPEILDVSAIVQEDGSAIFSCTMNDTRSLTDCGFVYTAEGEDEGTRLPAKIGDERHFGAVSSILPEGTYTFRAFAGNGRTVLESATKSFTIEPRQNPDDPDDPPTPPPVPDGSKSMILKVDAGSEKRVFLPLRGAVDVSVDWGDGATEAVKGQYDGNTWPFHKYASGGIYEVCIAGSAAAICTVGNSVEMPGTEKILAIKRWGDLGVSSYYAAFRNCINLSEVAKDSLRAFSRAREAVAVFMGCTSLKTVPDSLFAWHRGGNFGALFSECTALVAIPAHIFHKCTEATSFEAVFKGCKSLAAVPEGLFDDCANAEDFRYAFSDCEGLTSVPVSIFDYNRRVSTFEFTFSGCRRVANESPYTVIDQEKVHLYDRRYYPDVFVVPDGLECFRNEYNMWGETPLWSDYDLIPDNWK
jgi:hypothetical protein